jgi:hypothetical protein
VKVGGVEMAEVPKEITESLQGCFVLQKLEEIERYPEK